VKIKMRQMSILY